MPLWRIFYVENMSLNAIRENKILAKISEFTVLILIMQYVHNVWSNIFFIRKQYRSRSAGFIGSNLIRIHSVIHPHNKSISKIKLSQWTGCNSN